MKSIGKGNKGIPAFTVILLMTVMAFAGVVTLPSLDVSYLPEVSERSLRVTFKWPGVPERIIESEVTSVLEGALSGIRGCTGVRSSSAKGSGSISLSFDRRTDMQAVRFDVASRVRNVYSSFPDGVSYPDISLGIRGTRSRTDMVYIFKSPLPSHEIAGYVSDNILYPLSSEDGVERVSVGGVTSNELEILFDSDKAEMYGVSAEDIRRAYTDYFRKDIAGAVYENGMMSVIRLQTGQAGRLEPIPVANVSGRVIHLGDIATFRYREAEPEAYFRLNGLNTVTVNIGFSPDANIISASSAVRNRMDALKGYFPQEISADLSYDSSAYMKKELDKIVFRTLLCVLILLVLVFLSYRSVRYVSIIFLTLAVNILTSVVIYRIAGLAIHVYTLAGITVSLGIIIDSSIVMVDHYSYYRNRSVFPALFGAVATTIGALCAVYLLPEAERRNLEDFSKVIIINLSVSLVIAYTFIPSLVDRFPRIRGNAPDKVRKSGFVLKANAVYGRYIVFCHRHRWLPVLILVAAFGLPLCALPEKVAVNVPREKQNFMQKAYNDIMSWPPYSDNRRTVDNILGSSFALFSKALDKGDFYREPGRDVLYIQAGMPEGCTVSQLNDVVMSMENYLCGFGQIESFSTNIWSVDNAMIEVTFLPEYEDTSFPSELKSAVMATAGNFGGANWRVWGVNESYFNNNVNLKYKSNRIALRGYNYDDLYGYAVRLMDEMQTNRRVSGPELMTGSNGFAGTEFNVDYDFQSLVSRGVNPYRYFSSLKSHLYDEQVGVFPYCEEYVPVVLRSSGVETFDLWNMENVGISIDSTRVKMSEIGSIEKKRTGLKINRNNQSYEIVVGFDFIGSYELAKKFVAGTVRRMNEEVLPIGYKAESLEYGSWWQSKRQYAGLLLLIIAIIYVICSMLFESLRLPFAVILMIPVSFIGVFLAFGLSGFVFDQGGFAAMVMLCGIVVNAGIYLINEYQSRLTGRKCPERLSDDWKVKIYIKAFNRKIHPIMLTVISSVMGLVPFLFDGPQEVFWFPFAVGSIAGLLFSLAALVLYLPLFCVKFTDME